MEKRRLLIIGCSDGIGLASARRLVARGWTITGISRSPSPLTDERYRHVIADVASPEYPALLKSVVRERGPFDACIYCAGIGGPFDVAHIESDEHVFMRLRPSAPGAMSERLGGPSDFAGGIQGRSPAAPRRGCSSTVPLQFRLPPASVDAGPRSWT
jgi:NAD(P)-dependent dehydrogenase (short-subunit alcohol dehydrogenase family)